MSHDTLISVGDAMRIVTVLELGCVAGLAIAALSIYAIGNLHIKRVDQATAGALLRYVISISVSYALLAVFGIAEIQGYYGTVLTWRTPIGFVAANAGLYALVNLLRFENARLDVRDDTVMMKGTPDP